MHPPARLLPTFLLDTLDAWVRLCSVKHGTEVTGAEVARSMLQRTEDERFVARQEAARGAVNIDWEERQRRIIFGGALLVRALGTIDSNARPHRSMVQAAPSGSGLQAAHLRLLVPTST